MSAEDRNPSPPPIEILESDEELELLHVDQIEGTAFSKKWTLKILLNLAREVDKEKDGKDDKEIAEAEAHGIDIPDDLENDLCKLWDMSTNMEVSKYLEEWTCVAIIVDVIMKSNAPRVVEICMGILGNMACCAQIALNFSENESLRDLVLATLGSSDAQTLIETTRLLMTCLGNHSAQELWLSAISYDEEVFKRLCFILQSSTNFDLLHATANLVDKILDIDEEILQDWSNSTFIQGVAEAMKQVKNDKPETAAILLHTLQLLSTTDMGVETLVECTETILPLVTNFISSVCEREDFLCIHGNENSIASAVSVLDVLANTSPPNVDAVLKHDKQTMANLLIILSASKSADPAQKKPDVPTLPPAKKSSRRQTPSTNDSQHKDASVVDADNDSKSETNSNKDASVLSSDVPTAQPEEGVNTTQIAQEPQSGEAVTKGATVHDAQSTEDNNSTAAANTKDAAGPESGDTTQDAQQNKSDNNTAADAMEVGPKPEEAKTVTQNAPVDDDSDCEEIECIGVVSKASTVLTDVLMEFFCNLLENTAEEQYPELSSCLKLCDKAHVEVWKQSLAGDFPEVIEAINSIPTTE